jgi:Skp family chaperone for outer membrane proteins
VRLHRTAFLFLVTVTLSFAQASHAAPKVALVNIQEAILGTTDGQTAEKQLNAEFGPRKASLDQEQKVIADLQNRLDHETLSDADRAKLAKDIDDKTVVVNVKIDQADQDLTAAQKKVLAELAKKMVSVIVDYATGKGYNIVFDISSSQAPLLYAENATDITSEVVTAYESRQKSAAAR